MTKEKKNQARINFRNKAREVTTDLNVLKGMLRNSTP
jgi:hypothetical protein